MSTLFKWLGIILGGLVGLILLVGLGLYVNTGFRLSKTYNIQAETITIPTDSASLERGEQWVASECRHCHGNDLGGTDFFNDPNLAMIPAPNLTPGQGGAGSEFSDADWVRAIRHGVDPESRSLVTMPSGDFYHFSDSDLGDIIAYLKSVPPVDKTWPEPQISPVAKILVGLGAFGNVLSAENIDHSAARPAAPAPGVTAAYGAYVASVSGCATCHGAGLTGGKDPDPKAPPAPDLTPSSELASWSETQFIAAFRTGMTPNGRTLSDSMPWKDFGNMSDEKLKALWLYLKSLPPK